MYLVFLLNFFTRLRSFLLIDFLVFFFQFLTLLENLFLLIYKKTRIIYIAYWFEFILTKKIIIIL